MKYRGQMQTSLLNDRQIRASEYRKWDHAARQFKTGKEPETVDADKAEIQKNAGWLKKLMRLSIDDRTSKVAIVDGHHRAIALKKLGIRQFDFTWGWRRAFSNTTEHTPFPYNVLGL